jgi:hypothetical protein
VRGAGRLAWLPLLLVGAGCLQGQRVIKVNADGSGTIEDTLIPGAQLKGLMAMGENKDGDSKARMKAAAAAMGPGVTLVSDEKTPEGTLQAVFAFKDISQIKVDMSPGPDDGESKSPPLTFRFARQGGQSVLTVVQVRPQPAADAPKPPEGMEQMAEGMWGMMKGMMKGLKLKTVLQVKGQLVKAGTPHADAKTGTVTLLDMDFDQIAADEANFKKFTQAGADPERMSPKLLQGVKGVKIAPEPEVTIVFAAPE